ncbi:MAG: Hsp20/alpha crystallin family protein [Candidatus Binatia bacterium]
MRELIHWNPFRELASWHTDIDDLFSGGFPSPVTKRGAEPLGAEWLPAVETFSKDGKQILRLDLPGVEPKDVEVAMVDDTLIIKGERKSSDEVKEKDYHYRETSYGRFERRLALPNGVDGNKVQAAYKNGVLEISIRLPAKLTRQSIPIQTDENRSDKLSAA